MSLDKDRLAHSLLAQQHQTKATGNKLGEINNAIDRLEENNTTDFEILRISIYHAETAVSMIENGGSLSEVDLQSIQTLNSTDRAIVDEIEELDILSFDNDAGSEEFYAEVCKYAERNSIEFPLDPYRSLMPISQRITLEKRIKDDFTLKSAKCDRLDYMIAATAGLVGGLIDIIFVGMPGNGAIGRFTDDAADGAVRAFAKLNGWKGPREGSDPTSSAIGFLERKFTINYDHRHGADVGHAFQMSTKNHHIKSLGHSPDLVGLFFSILDQFTSTASFIDGGQIIRIKTENFELSGSNFVSKIFSGFVNWLGHLFSDAAGSSGASGRGSGIPIPFYSLLQFVNVGEFGQHRQTFAKVAVQVFEKGYDLRHGAALAVPVIITELIARIAWVFKRRIYENLPWGDCIPSANNPEMRHILCVSHGTLCLVDGADAGIRSGGTVIGFMLHANLIAWSRFSILALKELTCWYRSGSLDVDTIDEHLENELKRLSTNS